MYREIRSMQITIKEDFCAQIPSIPAVPDDNSSLEKTDQQATTGPNESPRSDSRSDVEIVVPKEYFASRGPAIAELVKVFVVIRNWLLNGIVVQEGKHVVQPLANGNVQDMSKFRKQPTEVVGEINKKSFRAKFQEGYRKLVFEPVHISDTWYKVWSAIVTLAFLYNFVIVIARSSFCDLQRQYWIHWLILDLIADVINLLDFSVLIRRVYLMNGIAVTNVRALRRNYVHSTHFCLDVASVVPTDLLYVAFGVNIPFVRMNRLLRYQRADEFISSIETVSKWPNLFRILKLSATAFVLFHWDGCFYFLLSRAYGLGVSSWAFNYGRIIDPIFNCPADNATFWSMSNNREMCEPVEYPNLTKQYLLSFYWAALILDSVGEQPPPVEIGQYVFTITNTIIGTFLLASIVGNVSTMITSININQTSFMECLDSVKQYMEFRKVQPDLKRRVVDWFNYVREEKLSLDDEKILSILPKNLRAELSVAIHMKTMSQVKLFRDCEPGLMAEIVVRLRLQIFNPGDYICRKGDVGNEMYIVEKGVINVVADDGVTVFASLSEGSVFGEISILNIPGNKNQNKRTASVRSVGYSKLFALTKEDLWDALTEYPEARKLLLEKGREQLRKDNLLDEHVVASSGTFFPSLLERLKHLSLEATDFEAKLDSYLMTLRQENKEAENRIAKLETILKAEHVL